MLEVPSGSSGITPRIPYSPGPSGVVNTILKKNYDGFEVSARYAFASDGGSPRQTTVDIGGGRSFNGNRSQLTLFYGYYHQDLLMATERGYAGDADKRKLVGEPFNTNTNFNNLNSSSPYGRFTAITDTGAGASVPGITATNGQFYYDPVTGVRGTGAGPTAFYNSQAGTQLLPRITRHTVFGTFDHKISSTVTFQGASSASSPSVSSAASPCAGGGALSGESDCSDGAGSCAAGASGDGGASRGLRMRSKRSLPSGSRTIVVRTPSLFSEASRTSRAMRSKVPPAATKLGIESTNFPVSDSNIAMLLKASLASLTFSMNGSADPSKTYFRSASPDPLTSSKLRSSRR